MSLDECEVKRAWREDVQSVAPDGIIADAVTGLNLAARYGGRETAHGWQEPRYRRDWSPQVLAIVQIAEQRIEEFRGGLRKKAELEAAAAGEADQFR